MLRRLSTQDVFIYRELRLQALQESPTAFGSSYEEESQRSAETFAAGIQNPQDPAAAVFAVLGEGAGAPLLGVLGFGRENRLKRAHSGYLWGMYVLPEYRRKGLGAALLDATLAHVRTLGDIRQVTLGVTAGNEGASALYQSRGFVRYGLEPDYLRIDGEYHAMEHLILMLE